MARIIFTMLFAFFLQTLNAFAEEYKRGDIIEKEGISYKVLVSYLVVDSKESPDTVKGPDKFYQSGELMVVKVDEGLKDVVIPPAVGRFKVVGLTDSLFYNHNHERIWLPDLNFAGNGCFARLKVGSGSLVIHNFVNFGTAIFDELDADLVLDMSKKPDWNNAFKKQINDSTLADSYIKGKYKIKTTNLKFIDKTPPYKKSYSALADNYKKWISQAFNDDSDFMKNDVVDKKAGLNKRSYSTTPKAKKKGFIITSSAVSPKWIFSQFGRLTQDYEREAKYQVIDKKKKLTYVYKDLIPVADATKKDGWYVKFVDENGVEVKYMLNAKLIKE